MSMAVLASAAGPGRVAATLTATRLLRKPTLPPHAIGPEHSDIMLDS
jgi:hypothetical protein